MHINILQFIVLDNNIIALKIRLCRHIIKIIKYKTTFDNYTVTCQSIENR